MICYPMVGAQRLSSPDTDQVSLVVLSVRSSAFERHTHPYARYTGGTSDDVGGTNASHAGLRTTRLRGHVVPSCTECIADCSFAASRDAPENVEEP